jgi:Domain of unknown function (DUF6268)
MLLTLTFAAPYAAAQDVSRPSPTASPRDITERSRDEGIGFSLKPFGLHTFESDLRDSPASVSITRAGIELGLTGALSEGLRWTLAVEYEASWYNWSDAGSILPGGQQPLGEVHDLGLRPGLVYAFDARWSVGLLGIIEFAGERDTDIGDAATYGAIGFASYTVSDDLSLTFGGGFQTRLENDTTFIPAIGIKWNINDRLTLSTLGPGARLTGAINDQWSAFLFGSYSSREYRLADDGAIRDGVVRDRRATLGVGVSYAVGPRLSFELTSGVDVYQKFFFDDENGDRVNALRTKPAPFVGLSGTFRF